MSIEKFEDTHGNQLVPDVNGDVLIGRDIATHSPLYGEALVGSIITIRRFNPALPNGNPTITDYLLRIDSVTNVASAVKCTGNHPCEPRLIPVYKFTATTGDGSCPVEMCAPGLAPDDGSTPNLQGSAVIFQGDVYNESTLEVSTAATSNNPHGIINIACFGTALSKLHFLRHTSASQNGVLPEDQPTTADRQTLLRLLTANYCGTSEMFTKNGLTIKLKLSNSTYEPADNSGFKVDTDDIFEAHWDQNGATCLDEPRLSRTVPAPTNLRNKIDTACAKVYRYLPPCQPPQQGEHKASSYKTVPL